MKPSGKPQKDSNIFGQQPEDLSIYRNSKSATHPGSQPLYSEMSEDDSGWTVSLSSFSPDCFTPLFLSWFLTFCSSSRTRNPHTQHKVCAFYQHNISNVDGYEETGQDIREPKEGKSQPAGLLSICEEQEELCQGSAKWLPVGA